MRSVTRVVLLKYTCITRLVLVGDMRSHEGKMNLPADDCDGLGYSEPDPPRHVEEQENIRDDGNDELNRVDYCEPVRILTLSEPGPSMVRVVE